MTDIPASLRQSVISRANNRCEYCHLSQQGQEAVFHIDHVQPRAVGGPTTPDNLALACVSCSLRKGARQSVPDLATGAQVPLFNPRTQLWHEHFQWDAQNRELLTGLTPVGNATIAALAMNRPLILAIRKEEARHARHPES